MIGPKLPEKWLTVKLDSIRGVLVMTRHLPHDFPLSHSKSED
jgi:hypothetical protein